MTYVSALHHGSTGAGLSKCYIADDVGVLDLGTAVGASEGAFIGDLGVCGATLWAGVAWSCSLRWCWVGEYRA